jgi:NTP pyrophosphatase (non-canonical NTP hydrolase)
MIAPVEPATSPWTTSVNSSASGPKTAFLKETVYHLDAGLMACQPKVPSPSVIRALKQLIGIVLQLRSPTGGWPADLQPTPENLSTYVSEEIGEFLDALDRDEGATAAQPQSNATVAVPMAELIPHVLWLLASSNYEVMRLLEGVRSRIYTTDNQFSLGVVRLVPVLSLQIGETCHSLDLVTQAAPDYAALVADTMTIKLVENDLDDQPMAVTQMLSCLTDAIHHTKPQLSQLLGAGWSTRALSPFQDWQNGVLHLHLYLATMGEDAPEPGPAPVAPSQTEPSGPTTADTLHSSAPAATGFTLDDFAGVLEEAPPVNSQGILGDWLTFTDETWVQAFLTSCAYEIMLQHLPKLSTGIEDDEQHRELTCMKLVYGATTLVQGEQALSNHTFVHEPSLVADVWLRLRWYLAHCSEQVMQLMGGLGCRLLQPGRGWQRGYLHLRPFVVLSGAADEAAIEGGLWVWILDLTNGRLLPTLPPTLPENAVVATVDDRAWPSPLTLGDLTNTINQDIASYAAAIAALGQAGTTINLHRLESEEGLQSGHLKLHWGFTLEPTL